MYIIYYIMYIHIAYICIYNVALKKNILLTHDATWLNQQCVR